MITLTGRFVLESARWYVSRRIVCVSASVMLLGFDSLILRRMSGSGKASMKQSNDNMFSIDWSALGYAWRVNFFTDWAY